MIFLCLFAFITSGFEHSVANMTIYSVSLFSPAISTVTIGGAIYNLVAVTLGNIVEELYLWVLELIYWVKKSLIKFIV